MKRALLILAAFSFALTALFAWALYKEIAHDECGLSEKQARQSALRPVLRMKLPPEHLANKPRHSIGSCSYSFVYDGAGKEVDFVILSTWIHGVKTTWWDHDRDEP